MVVTHKYLPVNSISLDNLPSGIDVEDLYLPNSTLGTECYLRTFRFGDPNAKVKVYLQAGLHGGEHPGMLVLHQLANLLMSATLENRLIGQVVIAPVCNPIGISQQIQGELLGRFNLSTGKNFNRGFPQFYQAIAENVHHKLSQDGTQNSQQVRDSALYLLDEMTPQDQVSALQHHQLRLALQADYVLDLHCDGESLLHLYGGETRCERIDVLSRQLGAQVFLVGSSNSQCFDDTVNNVWDYMETQFSDYPFASRSIAATLELRGRADVDLSLAQGDAENIFRVLQRWGIIAGDPGPLPPALTTPKPLATMYSTRSHHAGIIIYYKKLGDYCKKGAEIAIIVDPNEPFRSPLEHFRAPVNGILFSRHINKLVSPNMVVFKLAGDKAVDNGCQLLEE